MSCKTRCPTTRGVMMPRDTNGMGNIFGGTILSHIDLAGAAAALGVCDSSVHRVVTVAMDKVVFKKPVHIGDMLTCYASVTRIGTTSITTHVDVQVERRKGKLISVTQADVTYVAINKRGRPVPVLGQPPSKKKKKG